MKRLLNALLLIHLLFTGSSAYAESTRPWHSVLVCDGGAAVIDNRDGYINHGRGNYTPDTDAQIVIRNPQIVQYFIGALAMQPGTSTIPFKGTPAHYSGAGAWVEDEQWISNAEVPVNTTVRSFTVYTSDCSHLLPDGSCRNEIAVNVKYDGNGLTVLANNFDAQTGSKKSADWYFRNCLQQ